ncbi:MAG: hypothetical protein LBC85_03060 [Fibromonadaceae bacterium]|jgi:P pilus assembly chaperone PapD|nr:hypothetical protein [Fibromonadaceae bacterium]
MFLNPKGILFGFLFACVTYAGFSINPALLTLQVNKGEYNSWVELVHTGGEKPRAVELNAYERILDLDGNVRRDSLIPNKKFTIHPARVLLYPGERAKIQVIYKNRQVNADKSYFIHAREVPLPKGHEDDAGTVRIGLNVRVNYHVAVLLETGKPGNLSFVSSQALDSGKIELIMENKSGGRFPLENAHILANGDKITDFTSKRNSIMPGQQRRFIFEHHKPLTAEEVKFDK